METLVFTVSIILIPFIVYLLWSEDRPTKLTRLAATFFLIGYMVRLIILIG